jgi:hypothetical protein
LDISEHNTSTAVWFKKIARVHLANRAWRGGDGDETKFFRRLKNCTTICGVELFHFVQKKRDGNIVFMQQALSATSGKTGGLR